MRVHVVDKDGMVHTLEVQELRIEALELVVEPNAFGLNVTAKEDE